MLIIYGYQNTIHKGTTSNYKISNEIKVDGYDGTQVDDTTFKNIKQFIPLRLDVTKEDGLGKKISGAIFKLVDESGMEISDVADSEDQPLLLII